MFTVWGVWFAVLTLVVGTETLQRLKAERLAGTVILRLSAFHPRLPQASAARKYFNLISALILGLLMFFVMSVAALNDGLARLPRNMAITVGCYGLLSLILIASAVKMLWWRGSIRFGEAGILWDRQVVFWHEVTSTDWISPTDLKLHASDQDGIYTTISVHIPPHCRATIDQLLDARITDDLQIMAKSMTEINANGD